MHNSARRTARQTRGYGSLRVRNGRMPIGDRPWQGGDCVDRTTGDHDGDGRGTRSYRNQIDIAAASVIRSAPFYRRALLGGVFAAETDRLFADRPRG